MGMASLAKGTTKADSVVDLQGAVKELEELSTKIGNEVSDADYVRQQVSRIRKTATLNPDGSFRRLGERQKLSLPAFKAYRASNDVRGFADALRSIDEHRFATDGGGIGAGLLEEALGKPAWQHSGRQIKVVNMSPTEYLERSAKGHGIEYEELLKQLGQGDRTNKIIEGMSRGKRFAAPYLDYRQGFGQEGQHRAMAAAIMGQEKIPVAVIWKKGEKADLKNPKLKKDAQPDRVPDAALSERLKRGAAEGFDVQERWFHGSNSPGDIDEFKGNRKGIAGHFTMDPEIAEGYASSQAIDDLRPGVMPVHLRVKKTFDINDPEHRKELLPMITGPNDKNVITEGRSDYRILERYADEIKGLGYDSYLDYETPGIAEGVAVFDSNNIRSTSAQFKETKTGNILGGAAGAGVAVGASVSPSESVAAQPSTLGTLDDEVSQIASDEGSRKNDQGEHISYKDTRDLLTGGIGHLMTKAEQKKYPEGTPIPQEQVDKWWAEDVQKHAKDMKVWDKAIPDLPEEAQRILFNMIFNMGPTKFNPKVWKGLAAGLKKGKETGDYNDAADAMVDSAWYRQVGSRSKRLVERMRSL